MATKQEFQKYLADNKSKLDLTKLKSADETAKQNMFNEWKSSWSISNTYFKPIENKITSQVINKKTTDNKSVVSEVKKDNVNLWDVSKGNVMTDKVQSTISWMKDTNLDLSKEKWDILKSWAKEESDLIKQKNTEAEQRVKDNQAMLDTNKQRDYESNEARRKEADDLLKRQEAIAARQANITAAKAWASWLQLSDATMADIKADTITKYGTNLANAEQFRNQTNMTLDTALQNIDQTFFKNKSEIDTLLKWLSDEEAAPLINAVKKATEWNAQAIEDVKTYYNTLVQQKANEEFWRWMEFERIEDVQRVWTGLDARQKWDKLADDLKDNKFLMDEYWKNPEKYNKMSYNEAMSTLLKLWQDDNRITANEAWLSMYMQLKKADPNFKIDVYEKMLQEWSNALNLTHQTQEVKREWMWDTGKSKTDLTWITDTTQTFWLKENTINWLNDILSKVWVDKAIVSVDKLYNNWTYTKTQRDRIMNYLNNKK